MRNHAGDGSLKLTPEEERAGWTLDSLLAYQRERDIAAGYVAGNVVTSFVRPRPPVRNESTTRESGYDPHRDWK